MSSAPSPSTRNVPLTDDDVEAFDEAPVPGDLLARLVERVGDHLTNGVTHLPSCPEPLPLLRSNRRERTDRRGSNDTQHVDEQTGGRT